MSKSTARYLLKYSVGVLLLVSPLTIASGCGSSGESSAAANESTEESLLEPFDPPPLAELEKKVEWKDRPVLDGIEILRERQSKEKPLVTVAEALAMENNNAEDNKKILSALSRLPEDDDQVEYEATVTRSSSMDLKSTNPLMISSVTEMEVLDLTGIMLTAYDEKFNVFAPNDVVKSWQSSADGMYDKFFIRDDLTWSDGEPFTAHDIEFSFKTIMNPKVPVPAVRSGAEKLKWVQAYDDTTIVFFHKEALASNAENVQFPIIPKHIYEKSIAEDPTMKISKHHQEYETNPVTSGPYEYVSRERARQVVLRRREGWFMHDGKQVRQKPYVKEVRFKIIEDPNTSLLALKNGTIEETLLTADQWKTSQTNDPQFYKLNTKVTGVEWVEFHFTWNCQSAFFKDKRVRQAMSYAFDHDEMLDKVFYGLYEPCTGVFHPTAPYYPTSNPQPFKQDLDKAEALLDEAGWIDTDGDGYRDKEIDGKRVRFDFTILCSQSPNSIRVCTLLWENLDRIGIMCRIRPTEFTVMQQLNRDHRFQAAMGGWGTGTDPATLENIFKTDQGRNYGQYSSPEVDEIFEKAEKEFDREKRVALYARLHEVLYEDQPYTWLFYRNSFYGFNKRLRGYNFSPRGPFGVSPGFFSVWVPKDPTK